MLRQWHLVAKLRPMRTAQTNTMMSGNVRCFWEGLFPSCRRASPVWWKLSRVTGLVRLVDHKRLWLARWLRAHEPVANSRASNTSGFTTSSRGHQKQAQSYHRGATYREDEGYQQPPRQPRLAWLRDMENSGRHGCRDAAWLPTEATRHGTTVVGTWAIE